MKFRVCLLGMGLAAVMVCGCVDNLVDNLLGGDVLFGGDVGVPDNKTMSLRCRLRSEPILCPRGDPGRSPVRKKRMFVTAGILSSPTTHFKSTLLWA